MTATKVTAYRRVCDLCGEHDGQYYDTAEDANNYADDGWTHEDTAVCITCNELKRQDRCARTNGGHTWDTTQNLSLAMIWAGKPEFIMRHCGRDCGRSAA